MSWTVSFLIPPFQLGFFHVKSLSDERAAVIRRISSHYDKSGGIYMAEQRFVRMFWQPPIRVESLGSMWVLTM